MLSSEGVVELVHQDPARYIVRGEARAREEPEDALVHEQRSGAGIRMLWCYRCRADSRGHVRAVGRERGGGAAVTRQSVHPLTTPYAAVVVASP